ncbi:MAG: hypothetical protein GX575_12920 [Candidatus Anammoximicrobium sp.]|nr:hypothetical protein [Candidatus Anammoximicrobium sp.]
MNQFPPPDPAAAPVAGPALPAQSERDEIDVGTVIVVGAVIAVAVVLIAVLLQAWFYYGKGDLAVRRTVSTTNPQTGLGRALIEQQEQISTYRWINREAKLAAVPIERAMELVVQDMVREQNSSQP